MTEGDEYVPKKGDRVRIVDVKRAEDMGYIGMEGIVNGSHDFVVIRIINNGPVVNAKLCIIEPI